MHERGLRPALGKRGGGIENISLAPKIRGSACRVPRRDERGSERIALVELLLLEASG